MKYYFSLSLAMHGKNSARREKFICNPEVSLSFGLLWQIKGDESRSFSCIFMQTRTINIFPRGTYKSYNIQLAKLIIRPEVKSNMMYRLRRRRSVLKKIAGYFIKAYRNYNREFEISL